MAVLAGATGWYVLDQPQADIATTALAATTQQTTQQTTLPLGATPPAASAAAASVAAQPEAALPAVSAAAPSPQPPPAPDLAAQVAAQRAIDALGLTRRLNGDQSIVLDGRQRVVLGTKDISDEEGNRTLLLIQDTLSGDVDHWQPGLRFALVPGTDYERFIRENLKVKRLFVNGEYAEVGVDAAEIANQYKALSGDPRVTGVRFMALPVKPKPR